MTKKQKAMMSQMTPHTLGKTLIISRVRVTSNEEGDGGVPLEGKQPQILANADASDEFTFRAMVSSIIVENIIIS